MITRRGILSLIPALAGIGAAGKSFAGTRPRATGPFDHTTLSRLRVCDCGGHHQVDDNAPGVLAHDGCATNCPAHPSYNAAFVERMGGAGTRSGKAVPLTEDEVIAAVGRDILRNGPLRSIIKNV